jgi:hypothetical protein
LAARLARKHGVEVVRGALGLNRTNLKRHMASGSSGGSAREATFVELPVAWQSTGSVVELESGSGVKMSIRLGNGERVDVAELAHVFWSVRR